MAQFVIAGQTEGDKQLKATGQVSNSSVTLSFTILPPVGEPTIIISDNSDGNATAADEGSIDKKARLGNVVTITGTNFGAFEPIEIKFGQQQISVNSLADGSFNSTFVIAEQPDGDVEVTVTGKLSASTKTDAFTIEPAEGQPALEISDNSDGNTDTTDEGSIDKKASNGDTLTLRGSNFGAE
ncbi:MAG: IPT/TIG domain-containing protein, partial [Candidatus Poribacteria bacterium]|nr:IPT/TIG domain-containing protein [Candidatus Poribacteria bacterium]